MSKQEKEAIAKAPASRVRRGALDRTNVLTVEGRDPNFVYRFVNDTPGRIAQLEARGYVIESADAVKIGEQRVGKPSTLGSSATVHVGQGMTGVLMKQRKDWYDEDQAVKQAYVKQTEDATKPQEDGMYGKIDILRS